MTFNYMFTLGPLDGYVDKFPGKTFKRRPAKFYPTSSFSLEG